MAGGGEVDPVVVGVGDGAGVADLGAEAGLDAALVDDLEVAVGLAGADVPAGDVGVVEGVGVGGVRLPQQLRVPDQIKG